MTQNVFGILEIGPLENENTLVIDLKEMAELKEQYEQVFGCLNWRQ